MAIGSSSIGASSIGAVNSAATIEIQLVSKAFTFTSSAPTANLAEILLTSEAFTFTPNVPQIIEQDQETLISKSFIFTSNIPNVDITTIINIPSKAFIFAANAPQIIEQDAETLISKAFVFTPNAPTAGISSFVTLPPQAFAFTANLPLIVQDTKLLERAVNASCTAEVFIVLITITHSMLANPIRVSNDPTQVLPIAGKRGTLSNGYEYIFLPFEFTFPNSDAVSAPIAQLKIDNISREVSTAIASLTGPASFEVHVVLASDPDTIEIRLRDFALRRVSWDAMSVTGDITVEQYEKEPYPAGKFLPSTFPGLFSN